MIYQYQTKREEQGTQNGGQPVAVIAGKQHCKLFGQELCPTLGQISTVTIGQNVTNSG